MEHKIKEEIMNPEYSDQEKPCSTSEELNDNKEVKLHENNSKDIKADEVQENSKDESLENNEIDVESLPVEDPLDKVHTEKKVDDQISQQEVISVDSDDDDCIILENVDERDKVIQPCFRTQLPAIIYGPHFARKHFLPQPSGVIELEKLIECNGNFPNDENVSGILEDLPECIQHYISPQPGPSGISNNLEMKENRKSPVGNEEKSPPTTPIRSPGIEVVNLSSSDSEDEMQNSMKRKFSNEVTEENKRMKTVLEDTEEQSPKLSPSGSVPVPEDNPAYQDNPVPEENEH